MIRDALFFDISRITLTSLQRFRNPRWHPEVFWQATHSNLHFHVWISRQDGHPGYLGWSPTTPRLFSLSSLSHLQITPANYPRPQMTVLEPSVTTTQHSCESATEHGPWSEYSPAESPRMYRTGDLFYGSITARFVAAKLHFYRAVTSQSEAGACHGVKKVKQRGGAVHCVAGILKCLNCWLLKNVEKCWGLQGKEGRYSRRGGGNTRGGEHCGCGGT